MLSSKDNRRYSKKCAKNKCVCFNDVIWSMAMKMRLKMKNRSQGYDINRPRPRMGPNILNIKCVSSAMLIICIKQHLSNVWSSIHEKVKQHWGWVEKKALLVKKRVIWNPLICEYLQCVKEPVKEVHKSAVSVVRTDSHCKDEVVGYV